MFEIVQKKQITPGVTMTVIAAPHIAKSRKPGQFVILRLYEEGERIPLTIADADTEKGTITVVSQRVGKSTAYLDDMPASNGILDVVGPLGHPTAIELYGHVVCVGGGIGIAPIYPIAQALKQKGNRITAILGARTRELIIFEERMRSISDAVYIATDDGSYGRKGFVTQVLEELIKQGEHFDQAVAIGPVPMMKAVTKLTRNMNIPTIVSLNALMVDGTGMCGACRVTVNGRMKFTCVDGPEFDGHKVDFDELMRRLDMFKEFDSRARAEYEKEANNPECAVALSMKINKMNIPRQPMPEQKPEERVRNFIEVPLGYSPETAMLEAERCLQCRNAPCVKGCPVQVQIPAFIKLVTEGKFIEAAWKIKETNSLPAVCGRVCPQEDQCEALCVRRKKGEPVAIGRLERFAADYERVHNGTMIPELSAPTGRKIAVIGSGPSGLTLAGDLVKTGHAVTVFEALHKPGGVLVYGIPEFRLPKSIVEAEIDYLKKMGVHFEVNSVIGRLVTIDGLIEQGCDAVYVATGAGAPVFLNVPGENLSGIFSANEYLTRANLMKGYLYPQYDTPMPSGRRVVVLGGGNVAMDASRTAIRLGPEKVSIVYRRTETELPARIEEIHHAREEGVEFKFLTAPVEFLGDEKVMVKALKCIRMELGEPDESGRRRPVPIPNSEFILEADIVIIAVGNIPNPLIAAATPDLPVDRKGTIIIDEAGRTGKKGVFAGGDIVTGAATVIQAMGAGKTAAKTIHDYIMNQKSAFHQ